MEAIGLVCFLGLTSFDDIKTKQIRILEVVAFGLLGIVLNVINKTNSWISISGGMMIGGLIFLFAILSKEKIGKGDALIIMAAATYLGFINTIILVWISSVLAAIGGVIILKKYKHGPETEIPFVPFLLSGFLIMYAVSILGGLGL